VEGTALSRQMVLSEDRTSAFAGFLLPEAALQVHFSSRMDSEGIRRAKAIIQVYRAALLPAVEEKLASRDENTRQRARAAVNSVLDAAEETIATGRVDGGLAVVLKPQAMTVVFGGSVADGAKLDEAFRKYSELGKELDKNYPDVKFDARKIGDLAVHTMELPIKEDDDAAKVFGTKLHIAVATGKTSWYIALGAEPIATLQQVLELSKKSSDQKLPTAQASLSVGELLRFVASVEQDNLALMGAAAIVSTAKNDDHVRIVARSIPHGIRYRIEVEQGIVMVVGQAVKLMQGFGR